MSILPEILKILIETVAAVLLLLILLLHFRVKLDFSYDGGSVRTFVRYTFFKLDLTKKKAKGAEKEKNKEKDTDEAGDGTETAGKENPGIKELWDKYSVYLDTAKKEVRYLARHTVIKNLYFQLYVFSEYASIAGMETGAAWAFIGNVRSVLDSAFGKNVTYGETKVITCYVKETVGNNMAGFIAEIRPIILIPAGLMFLRDHNKIKMMRPAVTGTTTDSEEKNG